MMMCCEGFKYYKHECYNRFIPSYPHWDVSKANPMTQADPRGNPKKVKLHNRRKMFSRSFFCFSQSNYIRMCILLILISGVRAEHEESVSGIYLLRKSVEVEILVLLRIIHLAKSAMLRDYTNTNDKIDAYKRLSRYIRLMSGVQALLYHSLQNKTSCST